MKNLINLLILLLLISCSKEVGGGFGSETSSGMIALQLTVPEEAQYPLSVSVQKQRYNPVFPESQTEASTALDTGNLVLESEFDTSVSLLILDSSNLFGLWIPALTPGDDTVSIDDSLKKTGSVVLSIDSTINLQKSAMYIPGTGKAWYDSNFTVVGDKKVLEVPMPPGEYPSLMHTSTVTQTMQDTLSAPLTVTSDKSDTLHFTFDNWMHTTAPKVSGMISVNLTIPQEAKNPLHISLQTSDFNAIYRTSEPEIFSEELVDIINIKSDFRTEASLLMLDTNLEYGLWIPSITPGDDTVKLTETLKKSGELVLAIDSSVNLLNSGFYIPGTGLSLVGSEQTLVDTKKYLNFTLPPGEYTSLTHISTINESLSEALASPLTIKEGVSDTLHFALNGLMNTSQGLGYVSTTWKYDTLPAITPKVYTHLIPSTYIPELTNGITYEGSGVQEETKTFTNLPYGTYSVVVLDSANDKAGFASLDVTTSTAIYEEDTLRDAVTLVINVPVGKEYTKLYFQGTNYSEDVSSGTVTFTMLPQALKMPLSAITKSGEITTVSDTLDFMGKTADTITLQ